MMRLFAGSTRRNLFKAIMHRCRKCIIADRHEKGSQHMVSAADIQTYISHNQKVSESLAAHSRQLLAIGAAACTVIRKGGKLVFFGNGGSAADAQHLATEMVCRYKKNRQSIPALALTTNTSLLTATGNDYSFDDIFSRQIESLVTKRDMVFAISTSGRSPNVIKGLQTARKNGAVTVALTSIKDTRISRMSDYAVRIDSDDTARIQEGHILVGHIICEIIERTVCG
ncbi:MAG: SIS domain-containing protein [Elusimicrobia bacterium]|nr:SIS domain-containing protein [Elusimicrobiota bacterium]MBD3411817.1 SIS domain-containing protein [Elusimicrobiota bacterium]